jgi:hypothetical protein
MKGHCRSLLAPFLTGTFEPAPTTWAPPPSPSPQRTPTSHGRRTLATLLWAPWLLQARSPWPMPPGPLLATACSRHRWRSTTRGGRRGWPRCVGAAASCSAGVCAPSTRAGLHVSVMLQVVRWRLGYLNLNLNVLSVCCVEVRLQSCADLTEYSADCCVCCTASAPDGRARAPHPLCPRSSSTVFGRWV